MCVLSTMEDNTMFGVSSVYRDGGVAGAGQSIKLVRMRSARTHLLGIPPHCQPPDQTLGSKQMRASPSGGVINLSLVMQYIAMSDRWPMAHLQPPIIRTRLYDLLVRMIHSAL